MAQVEILSEREHNSGWSFEAQVLDDQGILRRHRVSMSWADYNLWSAAGADKPSQVAEAAVLFLVDRMGAAHVPERFDVSTARRRFADADTEIPKWIRP